MLSYLLDENMAPKIAVQVSTKHPILPIISLYDWRDGSFAGKPDPLILQAADMDRLTLVTYDLETIPPLLVEWRASDLSHSGVVLIDNRTVRSDDYGGLVRSLIGFWEEWNAADWRNLVMFLKRYE